MFSRVEIIGHLGSDPETRFTQDGASVCSFSVATSRSWTNNDGSKGKETIWWRVSAWGRLGEVCQQYLNKGGQVFIEGQLKPNRETGGPNIWIDQNGQARASYELRADSMKMLGRRGEGDYGGGGGQGYQNQSQGYQNQPSGYSQNQGYTQGARQAAPPQPPTQQRPPQQRPPQQSTGRQASAPSAPPAPRSAPARQQAPTPGARRTTMSAPQTPEFVDDNFGPDEIPF